MGCGSVSGRVEESGSESGRASVGMGYYVFM